jgi:flagellar hook-associated protein 3 FlgL
MINSSAIADLQRAQRELFDAQRKTATQKEASDLKGYGQDTRTLVSLDRVRAQKDAYKTTAEELNIRLSLQDAHLGRAADSMGSLKETLTSALALGDLSGVETALESAFSDLKSSFNATHNGKYMFAGTASDQKPIIADTLEDLAANPLANSVLAEGEVFKVRIDDNRLVNAAPLARDATTDALNVLRDLKVFADSAAGPFSNTPDADQKAAIQSALSQLKSVYSGFIDTQAANGQVMNEADTMIERHTAQSDLLASITADITDVDLAEVAVQLNQAQLQFQATASVFNTIQGLSLVDYLR